MRKIKEKKPEMMVMLLTAYGSMESAIEALRLGAFDYFLKPHNPEELRIKVGQCFENLELQKKVKLYEDILTVCCVCKKIQDDTGKEPGKGELLTTEMYLMKNAGVGSSHSFCTECFAKEKQKVAEYREKQKNS